MRSFYKSLFGILLLLSTQFTVKSQVCIPTYATVCFTGGGGSTFDVIDNFWTVGGIIDITNMDTDCSMLPDNYWLTEMEVHGCPGQTIETNVQCQVDYFVQGFAIWIDWNENDDFELGEKVYASPFADDIVFTGSFTIPADAAPGNYNMRVRSSFAEAGAFINPCDLQTFGETEDYIVVVGTCNPTICEGDSVELDLGVMPPGPITYEWDPAIDISDPFGGPIVDVWPSDTTTYICTITSDDSTWIVPIDVYVVHPANPFAGLDDSICHDIYAGYPMDAILEEDPAGYTLEWYLGEFYGVGSPSISFAPDEDILDPTVAVSAPGTYEFVFYVEDNTGVCPDQSDTILITYIEAIHELEATNPSCFGDSDGTITVIGTGISPTVEYSIDGGLTWQADNIFTGVTAGVYTVKSIDAFGCEFESEIELFEPEPILLVVSSDTLICRNGTATVTAAASGGGAVYEYDWNIPGADTDDTQTISPVVTPVSITVTAMDEFGCSSAEEEIIVTLRDPLTLTITENDSICPGFDSGASVTALGGDGDYTYNWTANGTVILDFDNTIATSPMVNTLYCVTIEDGCETTQETICTQTIINPVPMPSFTSDITAGCNPSRVNFEADLLDGDLANWIIGGSVYNDFETVSKEFIGVGFYDVTLHITNEYGCENEITATDYIEIVDIPYPDFFINPNPSTIFNTEIRLNPTNDHAGDTYEWYMPGGSPENSTLEEPIVIYPEGVPNDYEVTLILTNEFGCFNSITHTVNIVSDVIIYAPNVFTPDGDAYNDSWRVYMDGIDFYDFHCIVFNRWGEIVWESYNAAGVWDGTYGGDIAQDGTYVWIVQAKEGTTDKKLEYKGTVTILR